MKNLKNRLISVYGSCHNAGPASENEISNAESRLGVDFPSSYRAFLREIGASLGFAPYAIAGLFTNNTADEPPMWSNVVEETERYRMVARGNFPKKYIPIATDGMDATVYLDTSRMVNGECPVIAWGPGLKEQDLAASFVEFAEAASVSDPLDKISQ